MASLMRTTTLILRAVVRNILNWLFYVHIFDFIDGHRWGIGHKVFVPLP